MALSYEAKRRGNVAHISIHLFWRDLRLDDNPALSAAAARGAVVPVYIDDGLGGAAQNWQIHEELAALSAELAAAGSNLILRQGDVAAVLCDLVAETGATYVSCQADITRAGLDVGLRADLAALGVEFETVDDDLPGLARLMGDKPGGYRVFTPFWRRIEQADLAIAVQPAAKLVAPQFWPHSLALDDLGLRRAVRHGAVGLAIYTTPGRVAALAQMRGFADDGLADYAQGRDRIWPDGSSGLSTSLALGTVSLREVWQGCALPAYRRQLGWRSFARHLWQYFPQMDVDCWAPNWRGFRWQQNAEALAAWQQGRTGCDIIDAAMRALWVTGRMHNRLRMVVASYLTKNLGLDWRDGMAWFADTLVDYDRASNAMGWQWVAGCGADAAPYYRIFNPDLQADRHDPEGAYRAYWLRGEGAAQFAQARPPSWETERPSPPDLKLQRQIALGRWQDWRDGLVRSQ